jgi:uncharacterized protein (TIGR03437 family)
MPSHCCALDCSSCSQTLRSSPNWKISNGFRIVQVLIACFFILGPGSAGAAAGPRGSVVPILNANAPGAPQNVVASAGNGQATVSFSTPLNDGGAPITAYTVIASPSGATVSGSSGPLTVTGLANGTAYTFAVTATNSAGTGPATDSGSVTPHATNPGPPQNVTATGGIGQATVAFSPPMSDGGAPIMTYIANSNPGGLSATGSASPLTVQGLTNGATYTFTVTATNTAFNTGPGGTSNSVTLAAIVPGAPRNVSAAPGNGQATINFSPPASNGGAPITTYTVTSSPGGVVASGSGSPLTVTGLSNGTAYTFTVTATNVAGTGPGSSASISVTPQAAVPGAPRNVAAAGGNGQASVSFSAPASDGGAPILSYTVTASPGGLTISGSGSPLVITGLTDGASYTFTVTATNSAGTGPGSSASNSVTPQAAVPGAPQNVSAVAGNGQATISFSPPASNGGAVITSYTVTASPGGLTVAGFGGPLTVTGLANGIAYTFTVTATNSAGTGPGSSVSNSVIPQAGVPGAPQNVSAAAGNGQATISFSPPASNGGAAITNYTVTASPGGFIASGAFSPLTISGLNNGTAYTFTVTATNSAGTGPGSSASNSATPQANVPGAPQGVSATAGDGQATISFSAPASNGGAPIIHFTVTSSPGGLIVSGATGPLTITGLINGTAYTFTVTATNSAGTGPGSSASNSVTPQATVPGAPRNVSAAASSGQATISFTAPTSTGGSAITGYTITSSPGGLTVSGPAGPLTITGLTNGTVYTFTVTATNSAGTGPGSTSNSVTPQSSVGVPGAPRNLSAAGGNAQATISFTPPASNGGAPIIEYTVTSTPGGFTASGPAGPLTIVGLTNGIAYTFTVTATNDAGTGPRSSVSNSITPRANVPGAPQNVAAGAGDGQASISFLPPASDGGTAILFYTVTSSPGGFSVSGPASPLSLKGLLNGRGYTFTVTATNNAGTGPGSSASNRVTPSGNVPGAPLNVAATGGNLQAAISFSAPDSDGGSAILYYTVTSIPGGFTVSGPASPLTLTGLTNGTAYTFTVNATNSAGTGPSSSTSNSVTPGADSQLTLTSISTFPIGVVGIDYPLQILTALGGVPPYSFAISSGALPAGLVYTSPQFNGVPATAGNYTFQVTVTDSAGNTATLPASIIINPPRVDLIISQSFVAFNLNTGSTGVPSPASVTIRSSAVEQPLHYSVSVSPSVPWLDVIGGGITPGSTGLAIDPSALLLDASPLPYQATVIVTCLAPSPCAGNAQTILVDLLVTAPPPRLAVFSSLLSFQALSADPAPAAQPLVIQNAGSGTLNLNSITVAASWLTVSAHSVMLQAGPPVPLPVIVNPGGLEPGYYTSSITIESASGAAVVPVSLLITPKPAMILAPAGELFEAPSGNAPGNSSGTFAVSVSGGLSAIGWNAAVLPGSDWLKVSTPNGAASSATPGTVSFSIDPAISAGLAPQTYYGSIRVTSGDVVDSPFDFEVVLNVTPAQTPVKAEPFPPGLVFISGAAGTALPAQTVQVYASSVAALIYQSSAATDDGAAWLSVGSPTGSASSALPGQSSVSVNPAGLAPGTYTGGVSYTFSSAAVRTVNVTLIVPGIGPAIVSGEAGSQAACTPTKLVLTQVGLFHNFQQPIGWPAALAVKVLTDCGSPVGSGQVIASFSNGDPPLMLSNVYNSNGLFAGTWTPRSIGPQVTITSIATAPNLSPVSTQITGEVTVNTAPILALKGALHIFNPQVGAALAPGTIVQIYGSHLAAQPVQSTTVPLGTTLGDTSVWIGGLAAPLYYVSPGQINAQIPFELPPGNQYQVQVSANGALSTAGTIQLAAVAPGIAVSGTGEVIAQRFPDYSLVTDAAPAKPGEHLVIYLSGLGATDQSVATGAGSPSQPLAGPLEGPTLTLNGLHVPIDFVGLTPGSVGLYQINFQVPFGTFDGDLNLFVSQPGAQSNFATLPVKN